MDSFSGFQFSYLLGRMTPPCIGPSFSQCSIFKANWGVRARGGSRGQPGSFYFKRPQSWLKTEVWREKEAASDTGPCLVAGLGPAF